MHHGRNPLEGATFRLAEEPTLTSHALALQVAAARPPECQSIVAIMYWNSMKTKMNKTFPSFPEASKQQRPSAAQKTYPPEML